MTSITRKAYAKINLTLDVGSRRPDGYHDIASIMQTVALHDTLTITPTPDVPGVRLEVTGPEAEGVPADDTNLVYRAAARLQKIVSVGGLHITLHKEIPSQAGLGGGSSDAAATLLAVNDLYGLSLSLQQLSDIGAALGADVPFFLTGGTALVKGLGEQVTPIEPLTAPWRLVIVKPNVGVSTAGAYAALDAVPNRRSGTATDAMLNGEMRLGNDFEAVILPAYPKIAAASAALSWTPQTDESFKPLLCGSGSAFFKRVSTREEGERLAQRIEAAGLGKAWVTATQGECE
ncbi:MAG: 4-(cytidine 5'-diphospho)-2-C-methyl-D-erythritol kinase [Armatimonadota bacterium]|nr:4-(cytidine 5'-diphospho)-2-C-methyl-D-erythritol kinase [Armatimonadota bacterium]